MDFRKATKVPGYGKHKIKWKISKLDILKTTKVPSYGKHNIKWHVDVFESGFLKSHKSGIL
jgi:hypothetical protein